MNDTFRKDFVTSAKIMVVGCGALGNEVLKNLALLGVGQLVIVDYDRVEEKNLEKSILFSVAGNAQGKLKVVVAAEMIKRINPDVSVLSINGDIGYDVGLGLIGEMDVVIGCVDNRWARYCLNRLCMRAGKPWIDGGITELEGSVKIFSPGNSCYACSLSYEDLKEMRLRFSCKGNIRRSIKNGSAPTTSIIASVIGAIEAQEAIKLVLNNKSGTRDFETLEGKIFYYDGKHFTSDVVIMEAYDEECGHHEMWKPTIKVEISNDFSVKRTLDLLSSQLNCRNIRILLSRDSFVDFIYDKELEKPIEVLKPARFVENFILSDKELNKRLLSQYCQNEITTIDNKFPFQDLRLFDLGIPDREVLKVMDEKNKEYFIELR